MASTTVSQFKQLFPATATSSKLTSEKVPVKLKLENDWGSETINDLVKLVNQFGVPGSHLHLSKVEDGSIAVIWLCSTTEVEQLKMAILETAGSLQTMGVLQVFIGEEELVLEYSQPHSTTGNYSSYWHFLFHCVHVSCSTAVSNLRPSDDSFPQNSGVQLISGE